MESNHRPPPYQGGALPTELRERETCSCCLDLLQTLYGRSVERETGIEPALVAWKATVLPLNYSRTGRPLQLETTTENWWREVDSNHRRRKPADLQSAPVGRLGIPPIVLDGEPKPSKEPAILTTRRRTVNAFVQKFGQTLKRKCSTSPSCTRYSLPSRRRRPASRAPASPLYLR